MEEVLRVTGDREAYFWHTQGGAELDLLVFVRGARYGFKFKYADAPSLRKSLQVAHEDLALRRLFVVYPGHKSYVINDWCETVGIRDLAARVTELAGGSKSRPRHVRTQKKPG
jgi:hypothetical protein